MFDITFVCLERRGLGLISLRILLSFGPFAGIHSAICPNSSLYRTVCWIPVFNLSEFFSLSDRLLDFTLQSVRILLFIGPFAGFHCAICPNSSLYRTVCWIPLYNLSEFLSLSDRFPNYTLQSVRILLFIGPFARFHSSIGPNSSLFRTVFLITLFYRSEFFSLSDRFPD